MNTATEKLFETLKNAAVTAEQIFDCIKVLIYAGVNPSFGESNDKTNAFDYVDDYCEYHRSEAGGIDANCWRRIEVQRIQR